MFAISYKEEEYQIVLHKSEKIWDKGKKLTVSILFKSRLYDMQIIKIIKTERHQTKKYQISKEKAHVKANAESPSRN